MNHEEKSDWEWVQRVQRGTTEAFEVLVQRHQKRVFNLLYRWLGDYDEAEEAAQEVFVSAFKAIRKFRGEASFSTWLYRIASNYATKRRNRMARIDQRTVPLDGSDPEESAPGPLAYLSHPGPNPSEQAEQRELQERVQEGLNGLEPEVALVILLHDFQGLSYEEMAGILEVPVGTVKSRLHRARQALKARLASYVELSEAKK